MDDYISRRAAINVIERNRAYIGHNMERAVGAAFIEILNCVGEDIGRLPSIQLATDTNVGIKLGTNLAEEYARAVRNWLVNYQVKCADLAGRYTPYEVLGWIVSDWRKENGIW